MVAKVCECGKKLVKQYVQLGNCMKCSKSKGILSVVSIAQPVVVNTEPEIFETVELTDVGRLDKVRDVCQTLLLENGVPRVTLDALISHVRVLFTPQASVPIEAVSFANDPPIIQLSSAIVDNLHNIGRPLVDVNIGLYGSLFMYSNGEILRDNSVRCRQYDFMKYEPGRPVVEGSPNFTEVLLSAYKADGGYNSFPETTYKRPLIIKTIIENDYKFDYGQLDLVFYDIETYNMVEFNKVPVFTDRSNAFIGLISVVHLPEGDMSRAILHIIKLNHHLLDVRDMTANLGFTPADIKVHSFTEDKAMAYKFFQILYDIPRLSVCIGFNSSSTMRKESGVYGYDLPWLMNRAPCLLSPRSSLCKIGNVFSKQITRIEQLTKVYFVDMAVMGNWALSPGQRNNMERFNLDEYLRMAGLQMKQHIGSYCELQKRLATPNADVTDLAAYCAYDSFSLAQLNEKLGALNKMLTIGMLLNVPLSFALHNTQAQNIQLTLLRQFKAEGYNVVYSPIDERERYEGAHTSVDISRAGQVLSNVVDLDYQSLYPSAIINGNLSPETLCRPDAVGDFRQFEVEDSQITDAVDGKITYRFERAETKRGIIPKYLELLLTTRKRIKAAMECAVKGSDEYRQLDTRQYGVKIIMNSIYGLMGSKSPIYSKPCAVVCTWLGRTCLKATHRIYNELTGLTPLVEDTDSIMAQFPNIDDVKKLGELVKAECGQEFNLLHEATFKRYCSTKAKKSYFGLTGSDELVIKGLSWSKYTTQAKEMVCGLFREILESGEMVASVQKFYAFHKKAIQSALQCTDWRELIKPYTSIVKLSGKNTEATALREKYKLTDDRAYTVEIKPKHKSMKMKVKDVVRIITDSELKPLDINITRLMRKFMSSIAKLTMKFVDMEDCVDYSEMVSYRTEMWMPGGSIVQERDQSCSVFDFLDLAAGALASDTAIHEVFLAGRPYRLFMDIDGSDYGTVANYIGCVNSFLNLPVKWAVSANGATSFHAISNVSMPIVVMRSLMTSIKLMRQMDKLDLAVYGVGRSLRFLNCPKISITAKSINKLSVHREHVAEKSLALYVISNLDNTIEFNSMKFSNATPFDLQSSKQNTMSSDDSKAAVAWMTELGFTNLQQYELHNGISFLPLSPQPVACPICKWKHERQRWIIYSVPGKIVLKCFGVDKSIERIRGECVKPDKFMRMYGLLSRVMEPKPARMNYINTGGDLNIPFPTERVVCIKSAVGTGKTKWLSSYLRSLPMEKTVLWLSFRRSFSADVATKCEFENYMDLKGNINLRDHNRLIVQLDSLHRVMFEGRYPDVVICDELTSLFEQMNSKLNGNRETTYQLLYNSLRESGQVIAMDALLPQSAVNLLAEICNTTDVNYVVNEYKPNKREIDMFVGSKKDIGSSVLDRLHVLPKTAKVGLFVTGVKLAKSIEVELLAAGRRVLCLHGIDAEVIDGKEDNMLMVDLKKKYFANPESILVDYDVLIYTGTLTAGISIELTTVELMIGIYDRNTCSPISFVQGMSRIRNQTRTIIYHVPEVSAANYVEMSPAHQTEITMAAGTWDLPWRSLASYVSAMVSQTGIARDELMLHFLVNDNGYVIKLYPFDKGILTFTPTCLNHIAELYSINYEPTDEDIALYELMKPGNITDEIKAKITKDTVAHNQWIDMLVCYGLKPTDIKWTAVCKQDILSMFRNRYAYKKHMALAEKFGYANPGIDFDPFKHDVEILKIKGLIANVLSDDGIIRPGMSVDIEVKNKFGICLIHNIYEFAKEFTDGCMPHDKFEAFVRGLDTFSKQAYPTKAVNKIIKSMNYELCTKYSRIDGVRQSFITLRKMQELPQIKKK